ncbi:MAG: alpha/beta hydrolase [Planctomycetes bacterium]|nr:alpha/beta hydrolase [Planctomycetota bacterium]
MRQSGAELYATAQPELVDAGKVRIPVRRYGAGDPVLFIHGWPLSGFTYRKLLPALVARYSAFVVDLPGAGDSDWEPDNDFSFHGHADNLKRVVDRLGLTSYRIVAHDTGATIARRLAVIDPARVRQLVLIDTEIPNHRPPLVQLVQKLAALPGTNTVFRWLLSSRRYVRSSFGFGGCFKDRSLLDGEFEEHFIRPMIASKRRTEGHLLYALGIDWAQLDRLAVDHAKIQARVLLLWGEEDGFFPIDRAREMIPQFASCAGLISIPGAKLFPHEEYPDVVSRHILEFFAT